MNRRAHWETVYRTRQRTEMSWYQAEAGLSVRLIEQVAPDRGAAILDVGGGASVLAAQLDAAGYTDVTVLDISGAAISAARAAMAERAERIHWVEADILEAPLASGWYHVWHDRAAFHFLTVPRDRAAYVAQLRKSLRPGGYLLIATFADDGPTRCSGLDVARYSPSELQAVLGPDFVAIAAQREEYRTPAGAVQAFTYCLLRRAE